MVAVQSEASQIASELVQAGADVNATDSHRNTVLHMARSGKMIDMLVDRGANVNVRNDSGETALWRSIVKLRNRGLAKALLNAGATPDLKPDNDATELAYAFEERDLELVRMLAAHGANVDTYARTTWSGEPNPSLLDVESWKTIPSTPTRWEGPLLFKSVYDDDFEMTVALLALGGSPNRIALNHDRYSRRSQEINGNRTMYEFTYSSKSSPFILAVQRENVALVERMLVKGAFANAVFRDRFKFPNGEVQTYSYSALSNAVSLGNANLVALLLDHGADVNLVPGLVIAATVQLRSDLLELLLNAGADADGNSDFGIPPLVAAFSQKWDRSPTSNDVTKERINATLAVASALVEAGSDVNRQGTTDGPLHEAVDSPFVEFTQLLLDNGADVNQPDREGRTPLLSAAITESYSNRADQMRVLVDACANLATTHFYDGRERTALDIVRFYHRIESGGQWKEKLETLRGAERRQRQLGCN